MERQTLELEESSPRKADGASGKSRNPVLFMGIGLALVVVCGLLFLRAHLQSHDAPSDPGQPLQPVQVQTPWWILQGVVPEGPEKDMGSWKASTFSKEQQAHFGIDELGAILDQSTFDAAISAMGLQAKPPWWILSGVKPAGPIKNMGTWSSSTFTAAQQKQFGIDEFGLVVDKQTFNAAIASLKMTVLPPWWITHHVAPAGPPRDMGGWSASTFSKEQQDQFGVDQLGVIVDKSKFDAALVALNDKRPAQIKTPWWIMEGVTPNGPERDMGGWTASTFTLEQQLHWGVDEQGVVKEQSTFDAALKAEALKRKAALKSKQPAQVMTPWWIMEGVTPSGPEKDMGGWTASTFTKAQQEHFGVDEQGVILNQATFDAALKADDLKRKAAAKPQFV